MRLSMGRVPAACQPRRQPKEAQRAEHEGRAFPAEPRPEQADQRRRHQRAGGCAGVEDSLRQRAFLDGEPFGVALGGAGPVAGFGDAHRETHDAEAHQGARDRVQRHRYGPHHDGDHEAQAGSDRIEDPAERGLSDGVPDQEDAGDVGVVFLGEAQLRRRCPAT